MTTWYCPFTATTPGIYSSIDDGATWNIVSGTTVPGSGGNPYHGFRVYSDGTYLLVRNGVTYTSANAGVTWTTGSTLASSIFCYLGDDLQIVVGANSSSNVPIYTSTNRFLSFSTANVGNFNVEGICRLSSGRFVFVVGSGSSPVDLYSDNGTTWLQAGTYPSGYAAFANGGSNNAFSGNGFITLGLNSGINTTAILKSGDGTGTLTSLAVETSHNAFQNPFFSRTIPEVFKEPGAAVCVFQDSGTTPHTFTTSDGATWTYHDSPTGIPAATAGGYGGITRFHNTGTFILVASTAGSTTLFRSTDGVTWNQATIGGGATTPINPSNPDSPFINATPVENPHYPDRGLPIEIAGPRNDRTKLAYFPTVRIYTS